MRSIGAKEVRAIFGCAHTKMWRLKKLGIIPQPTAGDLRHPLWIEEDVIAAAKAYHNGGIAR